MCKESASHNNNSDLTYQEHADVPCKSNLEQSIDRFDLSIHLRAGVCNCNLQLGQTWASKSLQGLLLAGYHEQCAILDMRCGFETANAMTVSN